MRDVQLPHGPRRSERGVALLSPSGRLLDERPAVRRVESMSMTFSLGDGATHSFTVGDRGGSPTAAERDASVRPAVELGADARSAAARRRLSTSGELRDYLRWRFSCRAGELLVADPFLLGSEPEAALGSSNRWTGLCGRSVVAFPRRRATSSKMLTGSRPALRRTADEACMTASGSWEKPASSSARPSQISFGTDPADGRQRRRRRSCRSPTALSGASNSRSGGPRRAPARSGQALEPPRPPLTPAPRVG
jgi:hypothetical protein